MGNQFCLNEISAGKRPTFLLQAAQGGIVIAAFYVLHHRALSSVRGIQKAPRTSNRRFCVEDRIRSTSLGPSVVVGDDVRIRLAISMPGR